MKRVLATTILRFVSGTADRDQVATRFGALSARQWAKTLDWLDRSGLALYFWQKVDETGLDRALPPAVGASLARRQEQNHRRMRAMAEEFRHINAMFDRAGVRYAALKGFALVPDYCADASLRTQYDHDYLLAPDDLEKAEEALRAAGYQRQSRTDGHPIVLQPPHAVLRCVGTSEDFYSKRLARPVELHTRLWEPDAEKIRISLPPDLWERTRRHTSLRQFAFTTLSDEDALVFQVLHAFRHVLNNWCRLAVFREIAYFLDRRFSDQGFWERFQVHIAGCRWIPEATSVVFSPAQSSTA